MTYRVKWTIDIDADSHEEAARKALAIHRNPDSIATVFTVTEISYDKKRQLPPHPVEIDLTERDEKTTVEKTKEV